MEIFVRPAPGGRVRQPERQFQVMPEAGSFVPDNAHYQRLLLTGDVQRAEPPKKPKPEQSEPKTARSRRAAQE